MCITCCMHHMCIVRCIFSGCPWIGDPQPGSHVNYHGLCCQPSVDTDICVHLQCLKSHSMGLACNRGHRSRYTQRNVGNHAIQDHASAHQKCTFAHSEAELHRRGCTFAAIRHVCMGTRIPPYAAGGTPKTSHRPNLESMVAGAKISQSKILSMRPADTSRVFW